MQRFREMQGLGDIFISGCKQETRKRGLVVFLNRQKLEKIQKERRRLPAHVTNLRVPIVMNIERKNRSVKGGKGVTDGNRK